MKKKLSVALAITAIAPFGLIACGDDDEDSGDSGTAETTEESSTTEDTGSSGGGSTVSITAAADGSLAYEEDSVTAKAGEVTIEFDNPSGTGHDVQVDDLGGTDVITEDTATATLELEAGEYTFFCSVPGHEDAGMEGTLTVE